MSRQIGVEIEFYGIDVLGTADLLVGLFHGDIQKINHSEAVVENSELGDIKVELDARLAHQIAEYTNKNKDNKLLQSLEQSSSELLRLASVPVEIVFPPINIEKLNKLDSVIPTLYQAGAKGTQDNPIFAFGVHLNVSTQETDVSYFQNMLLSFFLLQVWLAEKTRQDFSRIISGYNKLYPHKFGIGLIEQKFDALVNLIEFYKKYIPDRNYALDIYPLWAYLHEECLSKEKQDLVKARPTFHYRLPDCKLGQNGWSFSQEYDWWLEVEILSKDTKKLENMADMYHQNIKSFSDPFGSDWLNILENQWGYGEK